MPSRGDKPSSPTAKIAAVLAAVARSGPAPVSEVAAEARLAAPTAHRICSELERLGLIQRAPGTRDWTVGPALVGLAANVLTSAASFATVDAVLRRMVAETGEMTSLAVQSGDAVHYIASAEAPHDLNLSFRAGQRAPLAPTSSGRLFLSRLDDAAVLRFLSAAPPPAYTPLTERDPVRIAEEVARIRARGYALTNQEYVLHVVGVAVPVEAADGTFFGALSIAAPDVRMSLTRLRQTVPLLKSAAGEIAAALAAPRTTGAGRGRTARRVLKPRRRRA